MAKKEIVKNEEVRRTTTVDVRTEIPFNLLSQKNLIRSGILTSPINFIFCNHDMRKNDGTFVRTEVNPKVTPCIT